MGDSGSQLDSSMSSDSQLTSDSSEGGQKEGQFVCTLLGTQRSGDTSDSSKRLPPSCLVDMTEFGAETTRVKEATVEVDNGRVRFMTVQTIRYQRKEQTRKRHIVVRPPGTMDVVGETGIVLYDEIKSINGKTVEDKSQKKMLKKFRRIQPGKGGGFDMALGLRRWVNRENIVYIYTVELKLRLEERQRHDVLAERVKSYITYNMSAPNEQPRMMFDKMAHMWFRLQDITGGYYLRPSQTGGLESATSIYVFETFNYTQVFFNPPRTKFFVVISFRSRNDSFCLREDHQGHLQFVPGRPPTGSRIVADSRFFSVDSSGHIVVLRSYLHEDKFLKYDIPSGQNLALATVDLYREPGGQLEIDSPSFRGCRFWMHPEDTRPIKESPLRNLFSCFNRSSVKPVTTVTDFN